MITFFQIPWKKHMVYGFCCCVQLSRQTHTHSSVAFPLRVQISILPDDSTVSFPCAFIQNTSHSELLLILWKEACVTLLTGSVPFQSSQESYRAFPSSGAPLTNPCSWIYPTVMSLSGSYRCLICQSCSRNMFSGLIGPSHTLLIPCLFTVSVCVCVLPGSVWGGF